MAQPQPPPPKAQPQQEGRKRGPLSGSMNPFQFYLKEAYKPMREQNLEAKHNERMQQISRQWRELAPELKAQYRLAANLHNRLKLHERVARWDAALQAAPAGAAQPPRAAEAARKRRRRNR